MSNLSAQRPKPGRAIRTLLALAPLLLVACGGEGSPTTSGGNLAADFNGDGKVLIGVATDGSRDDGSYYGSMVDRMIQLSAEQGLAEPIIVDEIAPADAEDELRNLVEQGVDIVAIGSSALSEPLPQLLVEYPDVFWYCNCGSGYPVTEGLLVSHDRGAELWISGGFAAGLLMEERGVTSAAFIGCCDLQFERESFNAFVHGMRLVDESFTATYTPSGAFPFDFGNAAGATEAFNTAVANGAGVIVPFLGAAHEPIVALANEADLIVMSGGSSVACDDPDLHYDFEVKYAPGDYAFTLLLEVLAGADLEGTARRFTVGLDEEVGAEFCPGADPEHVAALSALNARIGSGQFADVIAGIVADAYGS